VSEYAASPRPVLLAARTSGEHVDCFLGLGGASELAPASAHVTVSKPHETNGDKRGPFWLSHPTVIPAQAGIP